MTARRKVAVWLCSALLVVCGAANGATAPIPVGQLDADAVVQELGEFPPWLPADAKATLDRREIRRQRLYARLAELGDIAVTALIESLSDSQIGTRQNAALALEVLSSAWYPHVTTRLDLRLTLPVLIQALLDSDAVVRARAAGAIGNLGAEAAAAVPALLELLESGDTGPRNIACIALGEIDPGASAALPALYRQLNSPEKDLKQFATRAIERISAPTE